MNTALRIVERNDIKDHQYYHSQYMAKHEATNNAWIAELEAAKALQDSGTWKETGAKTWQEYCAECMPYADSTYREARMNIPVAELAARVANTTLSREEANALGKKLNDVIPAEERLPMRLSVYALCLAYDENNPLPNKAVIAEAYEILKEERDSNTLNVNGETINVKELAQKARIKERLLQNIQAHSQPSKKLLIQANQAVLAIIRPYLPEGAALPAEGADLWISWKLPSNAQS